MAKFKINDHVLVKATGKDGYVKGREILPIEGSKKVKIEYIVRTGNGFENWKAYDKTEIEHFPQNMLRDMAYTKVYDVVDGYKITLYAKVVKNGDIFCPSAKGLYIGYAIYSPKDEYNEEEGIKIARHRSRTSPFCQMESSFGGEFNELTVHNIMDAKADYIKNNFDKFINKRFSKKESK